METIYPGAVYAPIPEATTQPTIVPVLLIFHTIVGAAAGAENMMRGDHPGESTFVLPWTKQIRQLMPADVRADCNWQVNLWYTKFPLTMANGTVIPAGTACGAISVETEDDGTPEDTPWTPEQCEALAQLAAWCYEELGIPIATPQSPFHPGVGYHSWPGKNTLKIWDTPGAVPPYGTMLDAKGRTVNIYNPWTNTVGKSCPGEARIAQFPGILERARAIVAGQSTTTTEAIDMLILDYKEPGSPGWTVFTFDGVHLPHIVDGNAVAVMARNGVRRDQVTYDELLGLIKTSVKTTPVPTTLEADLQAAWAESLVKR